jgi:hypothetical protein
MMMPVAKITCIQCQWPGKRWIRCRGVMTMTGENKSTWSNTCPSATLSTTNPIQSGLRLNAVKSVVWGQQQTAWAMVQPPPLLTCQYIQQINFTLCMHTFTVTCNFTESSEKYTNKGSPKLRESWHQSFSKEMSSICTVYLKWNACSLITLQNHPFIHQNS